MLNQINTQVDRHIIIFSVFSGLLSRSCSEWIWKTLALTIINESSGPDPLWVLRWSCSCCVVVDRLDLPLPSMIELISSSLSVIPDSISNCRWTCSNVGITSSTDSDRTSWFCESDEKIPAPYATGSDAAADKNKAIPNWREIIIDDTLVVVMATDDDVVWCCRCSWLWHAGRGTCRCRQWQWNKRRFVCPGSFSRSNLKLALSVVWSFLWKSLNPSVITIFLRSAGESKQLITTTTACQLYPTPCKPLRHSAIYQCCLLQCFQHRLFFIYLWDSFGNSKYHIVLHQVEQKAIPETPYSIIRFR